MKRFSKTLPITKGNLKGIREDKPAVIRIKTADGEMWCTAIAKPGRVAEEVWELRGGVHMPRFHFQYCTTATMKEAEELRRVQIREHLRPDLWRRLQRQRQREAQNVQAA